MFKALKLILISSAVLFFSVFCLSGKAGQAERLCPGTDALTADVSIEALLALQERLDKQYRSEQCEQSPDHLWLRGLLSLKLGNFAEATGWLELSLLRLPNRPGVLLDYALAQEGAGEVQAALTIYAALLADFDPSDAVRSLIRRRVDGLERRLIAGASNADAMNSRLRTVSSNLSATNRQSSVFYGQVALSTGFDSNLNSASSIPALSFSIENQLYTVPIPESDLPQSGRYESLVFKVARRQAMEQGYWGLSIRQAVRVPERSRLRSAAGEVGIDAARSLNGLGPFSGELLGFLGIQVIALDQSIVLRSARSALAYEIASTLSLNEFRCPWQYGLEIEGRRYPNRQILDGDLRTHGIKLSCSNNTTRFELFVRVGDDKPLDLARAGGLQKRAETGLGGMHSIGKHMVRFQGTVTELRDEIGYNPLILNNKIRTSERHNLTLEWSYRPSQSTIEPFIGYELSRQKASIDLFSFRAWQVHAGLRWNF